MRSSSSSSMLLALGLLVWPSTALASSRTPAEATVHAIEERINACAQRKPECPTATPTSTVTPSLPSTSTPRPTEPPTQISPIGEILPSPEPCWLTDDDGIVFDQDGAPVPCPQNDGGVQEEETETPPPTAAPTATATVRPPSAPQPAAASARAQVVVQTVVVVVTATPVETEAPQPTPTPQPTRTAAPTRTPVQSATPTATATGTATATSVPLGAAKSASVEANSGKSSAAPGRWEWSAFLSYLAAAICAVVLLVVFVTRRRVAVWKGSSRA